MPNMTVPMQAGGAKSLPAEMKVGVDSPWMRMRAEHPGYGVRTREGWDNWSGDGHPGGSNTKLAGLGWPGQHGQPVLPVNSGPLVLNPVVARLMANGNPGLHLGLRGLGDGDTTAADTTVPLPPDFPDPSIPIDIMSGLDTIVPVVPGWTGPGLLTPAAVPPTPPAGYSWAQVLNSSGQMIGQILAISQGGSVTTLPNGLRVVQGSQAGAVQGAAGGLLSTGAGGVSGVLGSSGGLVLMMGLGLVLVMSMSRR